MAMIASILIVFACSRTAFAAPFDFPTPVRSTAPIVIVRPPEGLSLPAIEHELVLGSISNPSGRLSINGRIIPVYKDGAFAAWLPVRAGNFTFHCELALSSSTAVYDRHVVIAAAPKPLPLEPLAIAASSLVPDEDETLRPGDWLFTRMQATPRQEAFFRVPGAGWLPMREAGGTGFYEGAYQVQPKDAATPFAVKFRVGEGWGDATAFTKAEVTFAQSSPRIAVAVDSEDAIVKTGPDSGNFFPLTVGMPFIITGHAGTWDKVWLSPDESGWIETRFLRTLAAGTPPPQAELSSVSTLPLGDRTSVLLSLDSRVPFRVEESDDLHSLTVHLYYVRSHDNWIIYRPNDEVVSSISVHQTASDTADIKINLKKARLLWGYHAGFEDNSLRIDIRRAPNIAAAPRSPFSGLRVFLDPGHMPSAPGALGPLGTREMDVNFAIAQAAAALLKKEGAIPLCSRADDTDEVGLVARPAAAVAQNADVFISIHNNNVTDEQNPYGALHGYSVFYYHPQSLALAKAIYAAEGETLPIPGEDVRLGNFLVIRLTDMPAVLSESAYMALPDQEAMLLTPEFRVKIAAALISGLRSFLGSVRERQSGSPTLAGQVSRKKLIKATRVSRRGKHPKRRRKSR